MPRLRLAGDLETASVSRHRAARSDERGAPVSAAADKGLLLTLLELARRAGEPTTSAAIAEAAGIPEQYAYIIRQRLEENRERGFVSRRSDGGWQLTAAGITAAMTGTETPGQARGGQDEDATPPERSETPVLREVDGILPGVPLN